MSVPDCGHYNSSHARRWTAACIHSQHSPMSPSLSGHGQNLIKYIEIISVSRFCFQVAGGSWLLMQVVYEYCREPPAERCSSCSSAVHSAAFMLQCGDTLFIIIHTTIAGVSIHNLTIFYCIMHFMLQLSSQILGNIRIKQWNSASNWWEKRLCPAAK